MCVDRRDFMKAGLGGLAALGAAAVSPLFALGGMRPGRGRSTERLVVVNVLGGWDSINVVVPHGLTEYYNRRPTLAVPPPDPADPAAALPAETGVGFSPLVPEIHQAYLNGELAVVQKTGYPQTTLSHFDSRDIMSRGTRNLSSPDQRGWLGRLGDLYFTQSIRIVGLRTGNKLDFIGHNFSPTVVDDLDKLQIPVDQGQQTDSEIRNRLTEKLLQQSVTSPGILAQVRSATGSAFGLADQVASAVANYTSTAPYPALGIGPALRDAARLIQGGIGTQVFYVQTTGGFDTHANQANTMNNLLPRVSEGIGAFIQDLKAMGEYDSTTIVVISEFGRRNFENGGLGTDHGHGVHFLVFGGQIAGGLKGSDVTDAELLGNWLPMGVDFRHVYWEILADRFGVDPQPVFSDWTHPATTIGLFT